LSGAGCGVGSSVFLRSIPAPSPLTLLASRVGLRKPPLEVASSAFKSPACTSTSISSSYSCRHHVSQSYSQQLSGASLLRRISASQSPRRGAPSRSPHSTCQQAIHDGLRLRVCRTQSPDPTPLSLTPLTPPSASLRLHRAHPAARGVARPLRRVPRLPGGVPAAALRLGRPHALAPQHHRHAAPEAAPTVPLRRAARLGRRVRGAHGRARRVRVRGAPRGACLRDGQEKHSRKTSTWSLVVKVSVPPSTGLPQLHASPATPHCPCITPASVPLNKLQYYILMYDLYRFMLYLRIAWGRGHDADMSVDVGVY
jgi:hypothetical protein